MSITKASISKAQQQQGRYFVSGVNTLVGQEMVELLRNDNENDLNPHIIVGSLNQEDPTEPPRGLKCVINTSNISLFARVMLDCDAIIYDVTQSKIDEIEFALKILKYGETAVPKTFILITTPLTWSSTPMKERKNDSGETQRMSIQEICESDTEFKQFSQKYSRLTEQDISLRRCPKKYEMVKELELKFLAAGRPHLRTYVICPGMVYGNGESILFNQFKSAWMRPNEELLIVGDGSNVIPMIHAKDLVQLIKKTIDLLPSSNYLFAVDYAQRSTQRKVIQKIAEKVGGGLIKHINYNEFALDDNFDSLTLNLWMKSTQVFENADDTDLIDAQKNPVIQWHSREGFCKQISKIRDEFKLYRGLQPVKVVIVGPSFTGKSYIGSQLSQKYRVPHIRVGDLLQQAINMQSDLGQLVRSTFQQVKDKMIEEAMVIFEAEKKKKKVPKGQPEPEFDQSKIIPRLPEDVLAQVFKWRLNQNDAQNLGYILDGFPKTTEIAQSVFLAKQKIEQETEQFGIDVSTLPKSVIMLEYNDEFVKERVKALVPPEELPTSKYNDDGLNKRLLRYKQNYEGVLDFFQELKIPIKAVKESQNLVFDTCVSFIERDGPIMVLQDSKQQTDNEEEKILINDTVKNEDSKEEENKKDTVPVSQNKSLATRVSKLQDKSEIYSGIRLTKPQKGDESKKVIDEETRNEQIRAQEREILDTRSQPLRQYLADNVVPYLTEGLIEICKQMPADPVLFLADFLEKKGNENQTPFPGGF